MIRKSFAVLATIVGLAGLGVFAIFVVAHGLDRWPIAPLDLGYPLLINASWLILFALQHSGMARDAWKQRMPVGWERSTYVLSSGIIVLAMVLTWQPIAGPPLWLASMWLECLALVGMTGAAFVIGRFDGVAFLGIRQAWSGTKPDVETLDVAGPYRWLRHPAMLGVLVFLWAQPTMSRTLAFLNVGLTLYVVVGIVLEERDLRRRYGAAYEEYARKAWRLIPWLW